MKHALLAMLVAAALQTAPPAPQTFRSGAQVVQVDVRVIGRDGKFVTDLGLPDFEITEDGVPQKIQSVILIGSDTAPSAPLAPAPLAPPAPAAPLAPSGAPRPPQIWVFVFDTYHLSPGGLNRTRDAVMKFLADRFHQGDIGGVIVDGQMLNNRLTADREELKKAAAAVKMSGELRSRQLEFAEWPRLQDEYEAWMISNGDRQALSVATTRACQEDPDACKKVPVEPLVQEKAKRLAAGVRVAASLTLKVVDALSGGLARMPGPKTIVFLSEGFILNDQESELRQAVGMAARAGAHFYSIDARGLNRGSASSAIIDQPVAAAIVGAQQQLDNQSDGPNSLAVDTGGFAIRNENNFGRALDEIQRDAATYYVVGYIPAKETFDGKYRAISVKVARPGTKVRARRGYLAVAPAALLSSAAVPPKLSGDSPRAKAELITAELPVVPVSVPVSPGLLALPESTSVTLPGETPPLPDKESAPVAAARARVDAGKMVFELGKSAFAPTGSSGGFGEPRSAEAERGWIAYEKGDLETAARHLGEAAKAPDVRPWVVYALGLSEFALRRFPEAAQAWERVRRDVPEFEPIYFSLADAYGLQREEGTALKVLREAERRWPADAEVANAIGVIQIRRGALDAAIEAFLRATTTAPDEALGFFNLARTCQMRLLKSQRYDQQMQKWIGGDEDRRRAIANFQKYLQLGGPYERQAREALTALGWS
jgi:VWFA-related protein